VATATLKEEIAKLIVFSSGDLANLPLALRVGSAACGFVAFLLIKRSVFVGVAVGEAVLLGGGYLLTH